MVCRAENQATGWCGSSGLGFTYRQPAVCSILSECGKNKYLAEGGEVFVVNDSEGSGLGRQMEAYISENSQKMRAS